MTDTLMVSEHGQFRRATSGDESRFYPASDNASREAAIAFDAGNDPVMVSGFAVYDTTVATAYAVALYPTKEMAESHTPVEAPTPPASAIEDEDSTDEPHGTEPLRDEDAEAPATTTKRRKRKSKR